jgi:hypothetical protein
MEPVLRDRWSQRVPAEPLETLPLVGGDPHASMEIELILAGVTARGRGGLVLLRRGAASPDGPARPGAQREGALHGRRREAGQHGRVLRPAIRGARTLVALSQPPPLEQAPDPRHDRREHLGHVEVRQEWGGPEAHARAIPRKYPIDHEHVHVDVEIDPSAEALNGLSVQPDFATEHVAAAAQALRELRASASKVGWNPQVAELSRVSSWHNQASRSPLFHRSPCLPRGLTGMPTSLWPLGS